MAIELDFSHHIPHRSTAEVGPPGQRSHPGVAGRNTSAFGREAAIWRAGAENDPVGIITTLRRQSKQASERGPCLQLQGIAALRVIKRVLEIVAFLNKP